MAPGGFAPTSEQLELSRSRQKRRKEAESLNEGEADAAEPSCVARRTWLQLASTATVNGGFLASWKIATWNILAQTLVRRELFPTSDCLKAAQRLPLVIQAIVDLDADVICLQEVDQLDKLMPALPQTYGYVYAAGKQKKHGCLILYKHQVFNKLGEKTIFYDEEAPGSTLGDSCKNLNRGFTYSTGNIGLFLALQSRNSPAVGCIIATTHLFWHPRYAYERARQAAVMVREVLAFQKQQGHLDWPCYLAGGSDFNSPPDEVCYSLLTASPVAQDQWAKLEASRVIHMSVPGPEIDLDNNSTGNKADPNPELPNDSRLATAGDGLLTNAELRAIFDSLPTLTSAYSLGHRHLGVDISDVAGGRLKLLNVEHPGYFEPIWTSYTHFWKTTIDYIFILNPANGFFSIVSGLLQCPNASCLEPGLPNKNSCPSDHLPLMAEVGILQSENMFEPDNGESCIGY